MCYVVRLHPKPGALSLKKCVEAGVPPGPLLGRLKAGEDIVLDDGKIVRSADVTSALDPGPVFLGKSLKFENKIIFSSCNSTNPPRTPMSIKICCSVLRFSLVHTKF